MKRASELMRAMLKSYANNTFLGFGENGMSRDWRDWNGGCHGYEGLLVENFKALLCIVENGAVLLTDVGARDPIMTTNECLSARS
jgi:hypothetical protein